MVGPDAHEDEGRPRARPSRRGSPTRLPNRCTTTPETRDREQRADRADEQHDAELGGGQVEQVADRGDAGEPAGEGDAGEGEEPHEEPAGATHGGGGVAHGLLHRFWLAYRIDSIGRRRDRSNRFEGRRHSAGTLAAASNASPARASRPARSAAPTRRSEPCPRTAPPSPTSPPPRTSRCRPPRSRSRAPARSPRPPAQRVLDAAARARLLRPQPARPPAAPRAVRDRRRRRRRLAAPLVPRPRRRSRCSTAWSSTLGPLDLGVLLIPGSSDPSGPAVDPLLESAAMDVAVIMWGGTTDDPMLGALRRRGIPTVLVEGQHQSDVSSVGHRRPRRHAPGDRAPARARAHPHRHASRCRSTARAARGSSRPTQMGHLDWEITRRRMAGITDAGVTPVAIWETPASLVEHGRTAGTALLSAARPPDRHRLPVRPAGLRRRARRPRARAARARGRVGERVRRARPAVARSRTCSPPSCSRWRRRAPRSVTRSRTSSPARARRRASCPCELRVGTTTGPAPVS